MKHEPTPAEVQELIDRSKEHELGIQFLLEGALDAVAVTFGVHAFVVDAARDALATPTVETEKSSTINA